MNIVIVITQVFRFANTRALDVNLMISCIVSDAVVQQMFNKQLFVNFIYH